MSLVVSFFFRFLPRNWFFLGFWFGASMLSLYPLEGAEGRAREIVERLALIFRNEDLFLNFGFFRSLGYEGGAQAKYYRLLTPKPELLHLESAITAPSVDSLHRFSIFRVALKKPSFAGMGLISATYTFHDPIFRLNDNELRMEGLKQVDIRAISDQSEINKFLGELMRGTAITDAGMIISPKEITVTGVAHMKPMKMRFRCAGTPRVGKMGDKVDFHAHRLNLNGFSLPGFARGNLMSRVNPILDFGLFRVNARVNSIKLERGKMVTDLTLLPAVH